MVDVLHTVIQTILYVRSSEVRNLYHARSGMYHHRVASKVIVSCLNNAEVKDAHRREDIDHGWNTESVPRSDWEYVTYPNTHQHSRIEKPCMDEDTHKIVR
jgi:hypothetical protein